MVDSVASWANAITVSRILLSPVMFWAIPSHGMGSWLSFFLWFVLCASDGIDGYIARRRGPTAVGAFLDPLADKVLVLGAMFTLVSTGQFPWVPVVLIAAREIVISGYRVVLSGRGISVPASKLAKYKTPRSIDYIDEMPRDPNGKLYKRKLRDPYWEGRDRAI